MFILHECSSAVENYCRFFAIEFDKLKQNIILRENVTILSYDKIFLVYTQRCYGRHYVTFLNVLNTKLSVLSILKLHSL